MNKKNFFKNIRKDLEKKKDPAYKQGATNFFNEPVTFIGVRTPYSRKIAKKYWQEIKELPKKNIFLLVEELLKSKFFEERLIALQWVWSLNKNFEKKDFKIFERWLKTYIDNWAHDDDFCSHVLGVILFQYPDLVPNVMKWTTSKNRWVRRAAAVSFIYGVRRKKFLKEIFAVSDILLKDSDDLVQKGYGWALKEASNVFPAQVFTFVLKRKKEMPRTALRYAIEKYPKEMRKQAMK